MPDTTPPAAPEGKPMTELEKYWAGEKHDSAKMWQEMDDSALDAITADTTH